MSRTNRLAPRSEKGLLTPDNCVVALIDLQPQMLFGVANFDRQTVVEMNVLLAKAARVFDVPVVLATVQALHDGYEVYVVEDCCGDVSQLAHENAMKRVVQAGAKPVTALSVLLEWQRDWAAKGTYDAVFDIINTHCGAYGMGVEYASTMLHGAPATRFPRYVAPGS